MADLTPGAMEDHSTVPIETSSDEIAQWVDASPEEGEEELPEINSVEDLRQ
jgi:hypothetical protein